MFKRSVGKLLNGKVLTAFFFLSFSCFSAQYRNGLRGIYMPEGQASKLPAQYDFFVDEGRRIAQEVFYQNLQLSEGRDSSFNSLELILFENRKYDFLKTGFVFVPQMNSKLMGKNISTVPVRNNNTWKMAFGNMDFATYDPQNNVTNFLYMVVFLNMTDEQVLAHFFNMMDDPADKKTSKYSQIVKDINKTNKIKIEDKFNENTSGFLTQLCKEINAKISGSECTLALYKTYIENKDQNVTRKNINHFFSSLGQTSVEDMTDDYLLPRGDLNFMEKDMKLVLPNSFFYAKNKEDRSDISFFINKIEQNLTYDFKNKTYLLKFKVTPFPEGMSSDFKFTGEYYSQIQGKQQVEEIPVKKDEVRYFEFLLFPDRMEVKLYVTRKDQGNHTYNYDYKVKNIFKIIKNNQ